MLLYQVNVNRLNSLDDRMVEFAWLFCFGNIKDLENEQGNGTSSRLNGFKNSSGYR